MCVGKETSDGDAAALQQKDSPGDPVQKAPSETSVPKAEQAPPATALPQSGAAFCASEPSSSVRSSRTALKPNPEP